MNEKTYPIYRFWISFSSRDHNVSGTQMFAKCLSEEEGNLAFQKFIDRNLDTKRMGSNQIEYTIRGLDLEIVEQGWEFVREDTWCCNWFNHYTFSTHLTDEELLESFQNYVDKHRPSQLQEWESVAEHRARVPGGCVSLMGAEDCYRWKGPCRCEYYRKRGIVMIDH